MIKASYQIRLVIAAALLGLLLPPPAQAAPATVTCSNVLVNGTFEAMHTGWVQSSAGGYNLISDFSPRSGQWGAYLSGSNNADDRLSQALSLPASASSVTLSLWWALESEQSIVAYDVLRVELLDSTGALLATLWQTDNTATSGLWDEASLDLSRYAGQQVIMRLRATSNAFDLTDFYLDDISVLVCSATGAQSRLFLPLISRRL